MSLRDAIHSGIGQEVVHGFHAVTNHRPPIYGLLGAHPGWSVHEADADGHVAAPAPGSRFRRRPGWTRALFRGRKDRGASGPGSSRLTAAARNAIVAEADPAIMRRGQ